MQGLNKGHTFYQEATTELTPIKKFAIRMRSAQDVTNKDQQRCEAKKKNF